MNPIFVRCLLCRPLSACGALETTGPRAAADADAEMAFDGGTGGCSADVDCDDGQFCNGDELCDPRSAVADARGCVAAGRVVCDDGVQCTLDRCSNELAACVHAPPDIDGDGHADGACVDADGQPLGDDCDDGNPGRFVGNIELCDEANVDEVLPASQRTGPSVPSAFPWSIAMHRVRSRWCRPATMDHISTRSTTSGWCRTR